jgi:hypothetical protein
MGWGSSVASHFLEDGFGVPLAAVSALVDLESLELPSNTGQHLVLSGLEDLPTPELGHAAFRGDLGSVGEGPDTDTHRTFLGHDGSPERKGEILSRLFVLRIGGGFAAFDQEKGISGPNAANRYY